MEKIKETCRGQIDIELFKIQYNKYRRAKHLENQRVRQKPYRTRDREELGNEEVKKLQNERNKKCIDKKRAELGNELVKKYQNEKKKICIDKKSLFLGFCNKCSPYKYNFRLVLRITASMERMHSC